MDPDGDTGVDTTFAAIFVYLNVAVVGVAVTV
jgi:hypothetical protein